MKQHNQIGKRYRKLEILEAKKGRTFVTPNNKEYQFDFIKEGNKYTFVIIYKGNRMRMSESDFNRTNIDSLLNSIEQGLLIN